MKKLLPALFLFSLALFSCGPKTENVPQEDTVTKQDTMSNAVPLKAGGMYLRQNEDSTWSVTKILVVDEFAVHIRMYSDTFKTKPADVNSKDLHVLIGHAPLAKEGFLKEPHILVKAEPVAEEELEGYKMYLDAMNAR